MNKNILMLSISNNPPIAIPKMTSNTTPKGVVTSNTAHANAFKCFTGGDPTVDYSPAGTTIITYTFDKPIQSNFPITFNLRQANGNDGTYKYGFNNIVITLTYANNTTEIVVDKALTPTWNNTYEARIFSIGRKIKPIKSITFDISGSAGVMYKEFGQILLLS